MKPSVILKAILAAFVFSIHGAWAGEISVTANSASATRAALKENGLDWALAPQNPAPDPKSIVRGVFSQPQAVAAQRALSGDGIKKHEPFAVSVSADKPVEIPSSDRKGSPAFTLTASPQPEGKILVKIAGPGVQEANITSGDFLVVSLPAADSETVDVYFVLIKND